MLQSWSQFSLLVIATANIAAASIAVSITIASSFKFSAAMFLFTVIEWAQACLANWAFLSFHGQKGKMVACGHLLLVESAMVSSLLSSFAVVLVALAMVIAKLEAVVKVAIGVAREVFLNIL